MKNDVAKFVGERKAQPVETPNGLPFEEFIGLLVHIDAAEIWHDGRISRIFYKKIGKGNHVQTKPHFYRSEDVDWNFAQILFVLLPKFLNGSPDVHLAAHRVFALLGL